MKDARERQKYNRFVSINLLEEVDVMPVVIVVAGVGVDMTVLVDVSPKR